MKVQPIKPTANLRNSRCPEKKRKIRELLLDCFKEDLTLDEVRVKLDGLYKCVDVHRVYQATCNNAPDLKEMAKAWVKKQPKKPHKTNKGVNTIPTVGEDMLSLRLIELGERYDNVV